MVQHEVALLLDNVIIEVAINIYFIHSSFSNSPCTSQSLSSKWVVGIWGSGLCVIAKQIAEFVFTIYSNPFQRGY